MKIPFLFGIHCHQPVDNFKNVVNEIVALAYLPFLEKVSEHPKIKFSVHFSGWLLECIVKEHKNLYSLLKKLSKSGQIEFFTGGFYEPVLASIPSKDRIGQIKMLNNYIEKHFSQTPKGLWLTERVWDNSIIRDILECGIEYVIVDDYHFISAGFSRNSLYGYYYTEDGGEKIKVFPIDKKLRYSIPFKEPQEINNYFKEIISNGGKAAILFDDGEKFGVWPKTYKWVYEDHWIDRFLDFFENSEEVEFMLFNQYADSNKALGLAYLPTTSYPEMGEWALFADKFIEFKDGENFLLSHGMNSIVERYLRGSIWKNFFIKYSEANTIHKRVLSISKRDSGKGKKLTDLLYKAECNDVFWHGIFGGIYLPNLRDNAYRYIIEAENILDSTQAISIYDDELLFDGERQVIINSKDLKFIFNPKIGGSLLSLDIKEEKINIQNTLSRRFEGYHKILLENRKELKEDTGISTIHEMDINLSDELKEKISFDWYDRQSFIDHFTDFFEINEFKTCKFRELGDFVNQPFNYKIGETSLELKRVGGLYLDKKYLTTVTKIFTPQQSSTLDFNINISTEFDRELWYVLEFNFHFFDNENIFVNSQKVGEMVSGKDFEIKSADFPKKIYIQFETTAIAHSFKVQTVSQSESGVNLTTQGVSILFPFKFKGSQNIAGKIKIN